MKNWETNQKVSIGIISPYRGQSKLLIKWLGQISETKMGSVEEFQGEEKNVIIVTTTRCQSDRANEQNIGFLNDINVSFWHYFIICFVVSTGYTSLLLSST